MNTSNEIYSSVAIADPLTEESSQDGSVFDEADLISSTNTDIVAAQLASAGPIGIAAAAAISSSGKKRRRLHSFETNPSIRKRQQTRLQRKLNVLMEEYVGRVGQQACIIYCTPGKTHHQPSYYKVIGSQPLENVIRSHKTSIMAELEQMLAQHAPAGNDTSMMFELPTLTVDGIPTQLDKMTQAQLRNFIPEMLKFSTGKSKPGWGKPECRPVWWPADVPWANVRSDVRDEDQKKSVSWTHALRTIVLNCYRHHGREDLLPNFPRDELKSTAMYHIDSSGATLIQAINNPDGSTAYITIDTGDPAHGEMITLSDGSQARVVHAIPTGQANATMGFVQTGNGTLGSLITEDGHLLLTGAGGSLNMYSIYQPILSNYTSDMGQLSSSSTDGYQLLAAASEGQLTLTEVTPKLEKCAQDDDDEQNHGIRAADLNGPLDIIVS